MKSILSRVFKEQSSYTGIAMFVIILLLARASGLDVLKMTKELTEVLTALGLMAAAAKVIFPDAPKVPPPEPPTNQ